MKIFVFEKLKNGIWKPWYIRRMGFREALKLGHKDAKSYIHRIRRVKTPEELEEYISKSVILYNEKEVNADLWKVEWIT